MSWHGTAKKPLRKSQRFSFQLNCETRPQTHFGLSARGPGKSSLTNLADQIAISRLINHRPSFALLTTFKLIPVFIWNELTRVGIEPKERPMSILSERTIHCDDRLSKLKNVSSDSYKHLRNCQLHLRIAGRTALPVNDFYAPFTS
jgi:hypothetical protein